MKKFKKILFGLTSLTILITILIVHFINNKSMIEQNYLLADYTLGLKNLTIDKVFEYNSDFPNITVTTMPIKSMQANYLAFHEKYREAIELAKKGIKDNPYLFFSETIISRSYEKLNKIDSAYFYSKKAFYGLPNASHRDYFLYLATKLNDTTEINKAFNYVKKRYKLSDWRSFLYNMSKIKDYNVNDLLYQVNTAKQIFSKKNPKDTSFDDIKKVIKFNDPEKMRIIRRTALAENFFKLKDYESAVKIYKELAEIEKDEITHIENIALSYFKMKNYYQATIYYNKLMKLDKKSGKPEYFKGLILINSEKEKACELIKKSRLKGFNEAIFVDNNYCN